MVAMSGPPLAPVFTSPVPFRVQPNVPNAVTGNVTRLPPPKPQTVRFTVRLPPDAASRLDELRSRLDRYADQNVQYKREPAKTHSLVVTAELHDFIKEEARMAQMTVNKFLARILTDPGLTDVTPPA
jgi:hypothetical protein